MTHSVSMNLNGEKNQFILQPKVPLYILLKNYVMTEPHHVIHHSKAVTLSRYVTIVSLVYMATGSSKNNLKNDNRDSKCAS